MRKTLMAIILLTCIGQAYAQEIAQVDLEKELAEHPERTRARADILNKLAFSTNYSFAEREQMSREALSISREKNYEQGIFIATTNTGYYLVRMGNRQAGDSMMAVARNLAYESGDPDLISLIVYRTGLALLAANDRLGGDSLVKAEEMMELQPPSRVLYDCSAAIVNYYQTVDVDYAKAMEHALKAYNTAEKLGSVKTLVEAWITLGNLYSLLGDNENALTNLEKALEKDRELGNEGVITFNTFNDIGEIYRLTGRYPQALEAYQRAYDNFDSLDKVVPESNMADVYLRSNNLPMAFKYAYGSLDKAKRAKDLSSIAWIEGILARAHVKQGQADSALYYGLPGLDSAKHAGLAEFMRDNAGAVSDAYALKRDYENAYHYYLMYTGYRDSMLNTEVKNRTAVLQYSNEMNKKQVQIAELRQQKKSQSMFLVSTLIVAGLVLVVAGLLLRNNRQKQRANQLLKKQKEEIDEKAGELAIQRDNLAQSYKNLELLGEIGRQITSSLSIETIISTVYSNVNTLMDAAVFGIGIYHEGTKTIDFPATFENGKALPAYSNSIYDQNRFAGLCFISGKEVVMGDLGEEYSQYLQELPNPVAGDQPASLIYLPLKVREKMFGVITVQSFKKHAYSDYQLYMLRNIAIYAAIALENAEAFGKLNTTLDSLKTTQRQLVQSEKMASLGELTAGIAHEIQNPLNFVKNFSEVNKELINELFEEMTAGNLEEAKTIVQHLATNEDKIIFHGRRADGIVKGMLQHSRTNSGEKEIVDINTICEEYLRLAFHGLRAKDKSFNADFETRLDPEIPAVRIVPQDLGRVMLNLISNAFYAVNERAKADGEQYKAKVLVATRHLGNQIEVKVEDNGKGIPESIREKIVQPFFTTKPPGQGTGLGLSLSYDIVKAHGGDIQIDSEYGKGATFTIRLPT